MAIRVVGVRSAVCRCFRSGSSFANWASEMHPFNSTATCSPGLYGFSRRITRACAVPATPSQIETAVPSAHLQPYVVLAIVCLPGCPEQIPIPLVSITLGVVAIAVALVQTGEPATLPSAQAGESRVGAIGGRLGGADSLPLVGEGRGGGAQKCKLARPPPRPLPTRGRG